MQKKGECAVLDIAPILRLSNIHSFDIWVLMNNQILGIVNDTPYIEYLLSTNTVVCEIILTAISFSNSL